MANENKNEISKETSARIVTHMNDDHGVSIFAMAKSIGTFGKQFNLTDARLKKVSLEGCNITAVTCRGDVCEMKPLFYKFNPPLTSSSQVRSRMVEVHQQVCAPRLHWLVTKPEVIVILTVCALMGYGTWMGVPAMTEELSRAKQVNAVVETLFGSARVLALLVRFFFYFAIVAHMGEAVWAVYKCRTTLKLKVKSTAMWFVFVSMVGYPVFTELITLLAVDRITKEAAIAKKSK